MSALTFLSDNRVIGSTVTMLVGTENAQFPLTNLQSDFTTKVFRSNENAIELQVDLGATESIDSFAVVGSSVDGLGFGGITIYGSATTNFTGATAVSIDVSAANNFGFKLFTPAAPYRYWKIVINNTSGSYVELSNFYLGIKDQFANNGISTETFKYSEKDNSKIKKNRYGQRFIDSYNTIKIMSGQMKYINAAEFETLNNIYTQNKKNTPIWVILDPDGDMLTDSEYKFSGYFYFDADLQWSLAAPALYNVKLNFSEGT